MINVILSIITPGIGSLVLLTLIIITIMPIVNYLRMRNSSRKKRLADRLSGFYDY